MLPCPRSTAAPATALALLLAPAWGSTPSGPLPPPFHADLLGVPSGPIRLPARLAPTLSLASPSIAPVRARFPLPVDRKAESEAWDVLRDELDTFDRGLEGGEGGPSAWIDLSGFLRAGLGTAKMTRWPAEDQTLSRAALDNARLALDAGVGPLSVFLSVEGSTDGGRQFLIHDGEGGELEVYDAYADLDLGTHLVLRAGRFRAPVTQSTLLDENQLLFLDRTGIGQLWFERDDGVALLARGQRIEGWLAVQNGSDGAGDDVAITARAVLRLFGEGLAPRREGAYDADLGETVHVGVAWYEDLALPDSRVLVAEASYTFEAFSLAGEFLVPENGFTDGHEFWNLTASAMIVPERWEVAARYEDFRDRAEARLWRAGVVRYLRGAETKLQLGLSRLEHPDSHLDVTALDLTLVASF
jgi:hypothetical protein